jgi:hypothetical protein
MWKAYSPLSTIIFYFHNHYKDIHWIWNLKIVDVLFVWRVRNKLDMKDTFSILSKRIFNFRNNLRILTAFCFGCLCSELWDEFNIRPHWFNTIPTQVKQKYMFIIFIEKKLSFKTTVTYADVVKIYGICMRRFQCIPCYQRTKKYITALYNMSINWLF